MAILEVLLSDGRVWDSIPKTVDRKSLTVNRQGMKLAVTSFHRNSAA